MDSTTDEKINIIHLVLGLFFILCSLSTLMTTSYFFTLWVTSLGILFLFDSLEESLHVKLNHQSLRAIHYVIAAVVLISGITVFFTEWGIL